MIDSCADGGRRAVGAPLGALDVDDLPRYVVHCDDEKSARSARRVDDEVRVRWIEHLYCHLADVSRREELAPIPSKVRPHDFFVGATLHIDVALEQ